MFGILDRYIIKTFFAPFFLVFSVVFFIFMVNIVWIQLGEIMGKGLKYHEILRLLFYSSVTVISMVLPLTILLSSIMTFGEFGERYELAAMKAAGISLTRVMAPLFGTTLLLAAFLFFLSNNVVPDFQRKAKNMIYNITLIRPALSFTPGQFIDQIPDYTIRFDQIKGENGQFLEGVFIRKKAESFQNQQNILAKKGEFVKAESRNFLKLQLYDGYIFEESLSNQDPAKRANQPDRAIKFDTLTTYFDISKLFNEGLEKESIKDDYRFKSYGQLEESIEMARKENDKIFTTVGSDLAIQTNNYVGSLSSKQNKSKVPPQEQKSLQTASKEKQSAVVKASYQKLDMIKQAVESRDSEITPALKYFSRLALYQQRIISFSFTCILFFFIGSSLGSIIRKGGMGLPVVVAILIFIIFYVLNLTVENLAWSGKLNPYLAAWLPNIVLSPFAFWLTYSALTDSQLFDIEKYKSLLKPITSRFTKNKEHSRYK